MFKFAKTLVAVIILVVLGGGGFMASGGVFDNYKLTFGEPRWQTKFNNFIDEMTRQIGSLCTLITNWGSTVDSLTLIQTAPTFSDDHTLVLPGDFTSLLTVGKRIVADCGSDGLKPNTVASCTYAAPNSTVVVNTANLTNNLAAVSYYATRNGVNTYGSGDIVAGEYGVPSLDNLQAAVNLANNSGRRLLLTPGNWPVTDDLTITAPVQNAPTAVFVVATTKTLTINGSLDAKLYQIFSCTGTGKVVFGAGAVKEAYPLWWGAKGDGATDDTAAIQAALYSGAATVHLPAASVKYLISDALIVPSYTTFKGEGEQSLLFLANNTTLAPINWIISNGTGPSYGIIIKDIAVDGNKGNQSQDQCGIGYTSAKRSLIEGCYVKDINGHHGIVCMYCLYTQVNNNKITGVEGDGINFLDGNHYCSASWNHIFDTATIEWANGIEVEGRGARNGCIGIYNNTIDGMGNHGILITWSDFVDVTGNRVRNVGGNGIVILGSNAVSLGPNTVLDVGLTTTWAAKTASHPWFYNALCISTENLGAANSSTLVSINGGYYAYAGRHAIAILGDSAGGIGEVNINGVNTSNSTLGSFYATYVTDLILGKNIFTEATKITYGASVAFYANPYAGSFTMDAAASKVIANTAVVSTSKVRLIPTNAAAATLMGGAKSLYIITINYGTSFTVATADGNNAVGTETFDYVIDN